MHLLLGVPWAAKGGGRRACRQVEEWRQEGHLLEAVMMAAQMAGAVEVVARAAREVVWVVVESWGAKVVSTVAEGREAVSSVATDEPGAVGTVAVTAAATVVAMVAGTATVVAMVPAAAMAVAKVVAKVAVVATAAVKVAARVVATVTVLVVARAVPLAAE